MIATGFVNDQDLAPLYSGAIAFVYPTLYEGFGLPPLEAMRCGTAVISSNVSSIPEVVGDAGILVDPNNMSELADAMETITSDDRLREDLRRQGLARSQLFSWQRCCEDTVNVYRTIQKS